MKLLFFDTETTGKAKNINASVENLSNWPRVVQLAWQVYDEKLNLIEEHDFIVKPNEFVIPSEASAIHKITTEIAYKFGVELNQVLEQFYNAVNDADLLIAHNFSFDYGVMGSELLRNGFSNILNSKESICTMKSTTEFCKIPGPYGYKWPTLQELYFILFKESFNAHNALDDIRATARCFWELKNKGLYNNNAPSQNKELNIIKKVKVEDSIYNKTLQLSISYDVNFRHSTLQFLKLIYEECESKLEVKNEKFMPLIDINQCRKLEYLIYCYYYIDKGMKNFNNKVLMSSIGPILIDEHLSIEIKGFFKFSIAAISLEFLGKKNSNEIKNLIISRFKEYNEHDLFFVESLEDHEGRLLNNTVYNLVFFNSSPLNVEAKILTDKYALKGIRNQYPCLDDLTNLFANLGFPENYDWMSILK